MTKRELINRWNNKEGILLLNGIINCLTKGKSLSSVIGIQKHKERWDLRGAILSAIKKEQRIEADGYVFDKKTGSLKITNIELESIDFSFANISYSCWENCTVKKCLFEEVDAKGIRIVACDIEDCFFIKSNLTFSYLNENIGANSGSYLRTLFKETNLSESVFCFPVVKDCTFENCKLLATNFDGSRLSNCKFLGEVNSPWFRGYSTTANKSILGLFNRINVKEYLNKMENVDFSNAKLIGVSFSHEINLQICKFPESDEYIFVKDLKSTMEQVRAIIESNWQGEYKKKGLLLIDEIYFKKDKFNQRNDFIDTRPIDSSDLQFDNKFFNLIRDFNR